jgi:hypothetical protein
MYNRLQERDGDCLHALLDAGHPLGFVVPARLKFRELAPQRRWQSLLKVEQIISMRRTVPFDQYDVAVHAQAAGTGDPPGHVEDAEEFRIPLSCPEAMHGRSHQFAFRSGYCQRAPAVDQQAAAPAHEPRAAVQEGHAGAVTQLVQQMAHYTVRRVALDPSCLATDQRLSVCADQPTNRRARGVLVQAQRVEADMQAGTQAYQLPGNGCQRGLVEIIDIEVDETVVALVAAEIFQVQVAAAPGRRGVDAEAGFRQPVIEQMAGAAKE